MKKTGMIKTILLIAGIAAVGAACCWFGCGRGAGVVSMARVKAEADVYKTIVSKQGAYETELKQRVQAEFEKLQQADKKLSDARKKLSDSAYRAKAADLQKQVGALQARLQTEMRQIAFASQVAVSQAQKDIEDCTFTRTMLYKKQKK
ncbi:MAG: hypothetical protein PHX68_04590 [Alphaproteobacteria bacterium]|nr:hypothetical protein [Alphaproteobacteria bacterium]